VLGSPDHPYYQVAWQDRKETVFHPGTDAVLHPAGGRRPPARTRRIEGPAPSAATKPRTAKVADRPSGLRAGAGDRLLIKGHHLGDRSRDAEILEVLGQKGSPPDRVRWSDTGREGLLFPGPDATAEHFRRPRRPAAPR
jgi:hypothetical protein